MLQAAFSDCLFLDLLYHFQDLRASAMVDIGGRQVVQALMVSVAIVMVHEGADMSFEVAGQVVVL